MKNVIKIGAVSAAALALAGCMSSAPRLAETRIVSLPDAQVMPTPAQVKDSSLSIIVAPVQLNSGVHPSLGDLTYDGIHNSISKAGNTAIDRDLALRFKDELAVAEMNGRFSSRGIEAADIAVMSTVKSSTLTYEFTEKEEWKNKKGEWVEDPAHCDFDAKTTITVKAFHLPDMTPVGTWDFVGTQGSKTETTNSRCPISDAAAMSLAKEATADAIKRNVHQLLTPLAPDFYILERRDAEGGSVFRTNLGTTKGARKGAMVKIYKIEKVAATEYTKEQVNKVFLGEGEITEDVSADASYVYVDDKQIIDQIRRGHVVQMAHSECGIGKGDAFGGILCF